MARFRIIDGHAQVKEVLGSSLAVVKEIASADFHFRKEVQLLRHAYRGSAEVRTFERTIRAGNATFVVSCAVVRQRVEG